TTPGGSVPAAGCASRTERNCQRRKYRFALDAVLRPELPVAAQVEIGGLPADRECIAELRADRGDLRLEGPEPRARAAIGGELVVDVADDAQLPVRGQELRGGPVERGVDAVLVV